MWEFRIALLLFPLTPPPSECTAGIWYISLDPLTCFTVFLGFGFCIYQVTFDLLTHNFSDLGQYSKRSFSTVIDHDPS
jgi:hypothetical protein